MSKLLNKTIFASLLIIAASVVSLSFGSMPLHQASDQLLDDELQVTSISSGTVLMEWNAMPGTIAYRVSVHDLTTYQEITSFETWNTSATVAGLPTGRLLRFSVARSEGIIILDVIIE